MKRYRDLREQLNEDSESYYDAKYRVGPLGGNNEVDQADAAIFDLARPESVRRLNAYLGAAKAKPVLDPNSVLRQIQRKLSIIGLQFSIPTSELGSRARYGFNEPNEPDDGGTGETVRDYPLTYLGGRFGVLDNTGKIGYDDNISHRLGHGLKLRIQYVSQPSGMTMVNPSIMTGDVAGSNTMPVPSMMRRANEESYTTQNTGVTIPPPKPMVGDDITTDVERIRDDVMAIVRRLRAMTPGQNGMKEAYTIMAPIDPDKHPPREGLEGPFRMRSGKVLYYDPKGQPDPNRAPGAHYDPSTDMYLSDDEVAAHDTPRKNPHK